MTLLKVRAVLAFNHIQKKGSIMNITFSSLRNMWKICSAGQRSLAILRSLEVPSSASSWNGQIKFAKHIVRLLTLLCLLQQISYLRIGWRYLLVPMAILREFGTLTRQGFLESSLSSNMTCFQ